MQARPARDDRVPGPPPGPTADGASVVLEAADISRVLTRVAHQIVERNRGVADLVLLGIPRRGVDLADRLRGRLQDAEGAGVPIGSLDVTMYRDDLRLRPARGLEHTDIPPGGVDGKVVVLVDDVLFSGRTVRAALDALGDVGRPRAVQLAVLVDRGHRELPIRADYVGKNLPTSLREDVRVLLQERDGRDAVLLRRGTGNGRSDASDSRTSDTPDTSDAHTSDTSDARTPESTGGVTAEGADR